MGHALEASFCSETYITPDLSLVPTSHASNGKGHPLKNEDNRRIELRSQVFAVSVACGTLRFAWHCACKFVIAKTKRL